MKPNKIAWLNTLFYLPDSQKTNVLYFLESWALFKFRGNSVEENIPFTKTHLFLLFIKYNVHWATPNDSHVGVTVHDIQIHNILSASSGFTVVIKFSIECSNKL